MKNKRKILWQKWIDPLLPEKEGDTNILEVEPEQPYEDKAVEVEKEKPASNIGPIIVSPMGVIPLNEHNIPSKVFNFWMGHTNFILGLIEVNTIEDVPGVESLDIFTRYRFRLGIGKAFDEDEVMEDIENNLCQSTKSKSTKNVALTKVKKHLMSNYPFWAIFMLPSGEIDYRTGDTKESVKAEIAAYPTKQVRVLTSWEGNGNGKKDSK